MTALAGKATASLGLSETVVAVVITAANFTLAALIFAAIFKFVPNAIVSWRAAPGGGIFTAVLFGVGRLGLAWSLGREAEASAYGAATSLVLLLSGSTTQPKFFFLGAQFVSNLQYGERAVPHAIDLRAPQAATANFADPCDCIRSWCAGGRHWFQAFQSPTYSTGNASKAFLAHHCASVRLSAAACKKTDAKIAKEKERPALSFLKTLGAGILFVTNPPSSNRRRNEAVTLWGTTASGGIPCERLSGHSTRFSGFQML